MRAFITESCRGVIQPLAARPQSGRAKVAVLGPRGNCLPDSKLAFRRVQPDPASYLVSTLPELQFG